jgi:hypothetical protein
MHQKLNGKLSGQIFPNQLLQLQEAPELREIIGVGTDCVG